MFRDKVEEAAARSRRWEECPGDAPLDVMSWPTTARMIWEVLETVIGDVRGVVAKPISVMTFEGPRVRFVVDGEVMNSLDFATLVRAYPLIHGEQPRQGISRNAVAAVVVAAFRSRPTPMLLPLLDDRSVETIMMMHGMPITTLAKLLPSARPNGQQPASIVLGPPMRAPGAHIEEVVLRNVERLDRDLADLPHKWGVAARVAKRGEPRPRRGRT